MCAMPMPDEAELLQRARNGSESAFAELFGSQRSHLFRHSYRMLGSGPEADDAVQDALVRAWQRLETFDGRGSFQGWLYRIATNICLDRLRGRRSKSHPVQYGPASAIGGAMESGGHANRVSRTGRIRDGYLLYHSKKFQLETDSGSHP